MANRLAVARGIRIMANILLREGWNGAASAQNCDIMQIFRIMCKGCGWKYFLFTQALFVDKRSQPRFTRQLLQ